MAKAADNVISVEEAERQILVLSEALQKATNGAISARIGASRVKNSASTIRIIM